MTAHATWKGVENEVEKRIEETVNMKKSSVWMMTSSLAIVLNHVDLQLTPSPIRCKIYWRL